MPHYEANHGDLPEPLICDESDKSEGLSPVVLMTAEVEGDKEKVSIKVECPLIQHSQVVVGESLEASSNFFAALMLADRLKDALLGG